MKKLKIGIIGASSLASGTLVKLLLYHRSAECVLAVSEHEEGKFIWEIHQELKGLIDLKLASYDSNEVIDKCDLVFLYKHHEQSYKKIAELINLAEKKGKNVRFIDLSADYRLKNVKLYEEWYKYKHTEENLLKKSVYGLTELNANDIKKAALVANPGCYPTSAILSTAPLFKQKLISTNEIIIDAYSGVSGAGRLKNGRNLFIDVNSNITPYKIGIHPHTPEIEQELSKLSNQEIKVTFVPHVAPLKCGLVTTTYLKTEKPLAWEEIYTIYKEFYKNKPFIRLLDKEEEYPEIKNVEGTNFCDIGFKVDTRTNTLIIIGVIDNLIKGASGQAVQNMNIMYDFKETQGLPYAEVLEKQLAGHY